jgi:hypothetical protein
MKKLEWEYIDTNENFAKYKAVTEIGTYTLYANEGNGVYEVDFTDNDDKYEDVYGMYDIYDARQAAQYHYNAKVEATT